MTVEAHQLHMGLRQGVQRDLLRLPRLNGGAELAVHLAGGDGLIGVGIDAGCQPQQHPLPDATSGGLRLDGVDLLPVVRHEIAHLAVHGEGDVGAGLVVAVEIGAPQIVPRLQRRIDLAGGHHVDAHVLLLHDLVHPLEAACFAGVQGAAGGTEVLSERLLIDPALTADAVFIHQIQRRAVLFGKRHRVLSGKIQMPVFADGKCFVQHKRAPFRKNFSHCSTLLKNKQ